MSTSIAAPGEDMSEICSRVYFGRETCMHDCNAIARFGPPQYGCGTKLKISGAYGAQYSGHEFVVEGMFWSDILHSWVYYVPTFNFYQCESDLEEIK